MTITATDLGVRTMVDADVPFTAPLHERTLPHGLFAQLGVPFIESYHRSFLHSPHAVALVTDDDEWPYGFLLGTLDNEAHYRFALRRRGPSLARHGIAGLRRNPRLMVSLVRTRAGRYARRLIRSAAPGPAPTEGRIAVLHHVALVPGVRRCGAGRELVSRFVDAATEAGVSRVATLTRHGAEGSGDFYHRLGWSPVPSAEQGEWDRYELTL